MLIKRRISMLQSRNAGNKICVLVQRKELVTTDSSGSWSQKSLLTRAVFAYVNSPPANPAAVQLRSVRKQKASVLGSRIPCDCPHPAHLQAGVSSLCSCYKAAPLLLFLQRRTKALKEDKKKERKKKASPSQKAEHYRCKNFLLLYVWCSSYLDTKE